MQGSIRKRNKTWSYIVDIGKVDGKRKQKEKGGFKTKKEASEALTVALSELSQNGEIFEFTKITMDEVFADYIKYDCENIKKHSTIVKHTSIYNTHFRDFIGFKFVYNVNSKEIEDYLYNLLKTRTPAYIRGIHSFMLILFNFAIKKEYIKKNPMSKIKPPDLPLTEIIIYTNEQIKLLYERYESTNLQLPFFIAINTGIRSSECFALRWEDIDFKNSLININKQIQYINHKWSFITTKTKNGNRKIAMSNRLKEYLIGKRTIQQDNSNFLGDYYRSNKIIDLRYGNNNLFEVEDFINVRPNGDMLTTNSTKYMARLAKELGIDFKFHNLRHTYASFLLQNGMNIKALQESLGHSRVSTTLDVYTHVVPESKGIAIKILDDQFANI